MSGAATGGILAARAGLKAAGKSALVGGVILAAIEGLNILVVSTICSKKCSYFINVCIQFTEQLSYAKLALISMCSI